MYITVEQLSRMTSRYVLAANVAPSAHIRSWDPSSKETPASQKPSINHVEGNNGADDKATHQGLTSALSHSATKDISNADDASLGNAGSGGNGPSDVRSPTSTEVRSPTSTSTEVRSPTSTSTEAYTADNFTATVTGGAGAGANTTVNIYMTPPKAKSNLPSDGSHNPLEEKQASVILRMARWFEKSAIRSF